MPDCLLCDIGIMQESTKLSWMILKSWWQKMCRYFGYDTFQQSFLWWCHCVVRCSKQMFTDPVVNTLFVAVFLSCAYICSDTIFHNIYYNLWCFIKCVPPTTQKSISPANSSSSTDITSLQHLEIPVPSEGMYPPLYQLRRMTFVSSGISS